MSEEMCEEQHLALKKLTTMKTELALFMSMQAQGEGPPDSPMQASMSAALDREIANLESEVARPASQRLSKSSAPERSVLRAVMSIKMDLEPVPISASLHCSVVRYIEEGSSNMGLGLGMSGVDPNTLQPGPLLRVAGMPWRQEMGSWSDVDWAWFLVTAFRKLKFPAGAKLDGVTLNYKLQDRPQEDFKCNVARYFRDVCRTDRCAAFTDHFIGAMFEGIPVVDRNGKVVMFDLDLQNDLCYLFDTKWSCVALDLGIPIENRQETPALTFLVGNGSSMPMEHPAVRGKKFDSPQDYVRQRLLSAIAKLPPDAELSRDEALEHVDYIWELLRSQQVTSSSHNVGQDRIWNIYQKFTEEKLGKALRRVAKKYGQAVPDALASLSARRCSACGSAEGTKSMKTGEIVTKLVHCPCNTDGLPLYCGTLCQREDWKEHSDFCTAQKSEKGKKSGQKKK